MIIKWYNRDSISDVDMKRAKEVSNRLLGNKEETMFWLPEPDIMWSTMKDNLRRIEELKLNGVW